jgi:hypothetical protein
MVGRAGRRITVALLTTAAIAVGSAWTAEADAQPYLYKTIVPSNGLALCQANTYWGRLKPGTTFFQVGWDSSAVTECFGVAPDRSIWHIWRGTSGWYEMPGNGRGDNMNKVSIGRNINTGHAQRIVCIWAGGKDYCNVLDIPNNVWSGWILQPS